MRNRRELMQKRLELAKEIREIESDDFHESLDNTAFRPPKIPVLAAVLSVIIPALVTIIPGLIGDTSLSWEVRIIVCLSITCVCFFVLFMSTYLKIYEITYTLQVCELKREIMSKRLDTRDSFLSLAERTVDFIDEILHANAEPSQTLTAEPSAHNTETTT